MKLTTPKSILIGFALIAMAILYRGESLFVAEARAELTGWNLITIEKSLLSMNSNLSGIKRELSEIRKEICKARQKSNASSLVIGTCL